MLAGFVAQIAAKIIEALLPVIVKSIEALAPKLIDAVKDEIAKHIPAITAAVASTITQTAEAVAVHGVDKITDLIPGQVDDKILDPIVAKSVDVFNQVLHGFGL